MPTLVYGVEGKQPLINAGRVGTYQLIMRPDVITSSGKNLFITNGLVCDQLYKRWVESGSELDTPSLTVGGRQNTSLQTTAVSCSHSIGGLRVWWRVLQCNLCRR